MVITVGHESDPARRLRQRQGAQIRQVRHFRNLTLRQLAERMSQQEGISVTSAAVSEWERGVSTPRQHMQVALCKALDTPWSPIFGLDAEAVAG